MEETLPRVATGSMSQSGRGQGPASAVVASRAIIETWSILDNAYYGVITSGANVI